MNQAATKDAAARGATPGDLAQMASGAAAARQALVGSFAAQQAATNAADSHLRRQPRERRRPRRRSWVRSHRPAGACARRARARPRRSASGRVPVQYGQERRADEAKNVLAKQALGLDIAKTQADIAADRRKARLEGASEPARRASSDRGTEDPGARGRQVRLHMAAVAGARRQRSAARHPSEQDQARGQRLQRGRVRRQEQVRDQRHVAGPAATDRRRLQRGLKALQVAQ